MSRESQQTTALKDVGVNHGGFDIFIAEEFLDGANVVAILKQVGGEAVTKCMATDCFCL